MNEATSRLIIVVILLAIGIYWVSRPSDEVASEPAAPILYEKGTYLGPPDTPLDASRLEELRDRARNDAAPRL